MNSEHELRDIQFYLEKDCYEVADYKIDGKLYAILIQDVFTVCMPEVIRISQSQYDMYQYIRIHGRIDSRSGKSIESYLTVKHQPGQYPKVGANDDILLQGQVTIAAQVSGDCTYLHIKKTDAHCRFVYNGAHAAAGHCRNELESIMRVQPQISNVIIMGKKFPLERI